MQITKEILNQILQFRCPKCKFASFDVKATQDHLLSCGKDQVLVIPKLNKVKPLKIKEEIMEETETELKILDYLSVNQEVFNNLTGKPEPVSEEEPDLPYGVPERSTPSLFVPVNGPAVSIGRSQLNPANRISARHNLPAQPRFAKPVLQILVGPVNYV